MRFHISPLLILLICCIKGASAIATPPTDMSTPDTQLLCSLLLKDTKASGLTSAEESYVRLLEVSLQNKFLSFADLQLIITSLKENKIINPLSSKMSSSESLPYKHAFDMVIQYLPSDSSQLLRSVENITVDRQNKEKVKNEIRNDNKTIFNPQVNQLVSTTGRINSPPTYIRTQNGKEFIGTTSSNGDIFLVNLKEPRKLSTIETQGGTISSPAHISTADNRELLITGSLGGNLYVTDLNHKKNSFELKARHKFHAPPIAFKAKDNREFTAAATIDGFFYMADLNSKKMFLDLKIGRGTTSSPKYFVAKDGREFIAVGNHSGHLQLIDFNHPSQSLKTTTGSNISSPPIYFVTQDGREIIAVSCDDSYLYLFDLNNLDEPIKVKTAIGGSTPQYITTPDGREFVVVDSIGKIFYLVDLKDPQNPKKIHANSVSTKSMYFLTQDGLELSAASLSYSNLTISDHTNGSADYVLNIRPIGGAAASLPLYFVTLAGQEMLAVITTEEQIALIDLFNLPEQREISPEPTTER